MLIACTNKGCLKSTEAKLNKETNEVICDDCGREIANLTEPIKKTLASFGQIMRSTERKPFQVQCTKCKAPRDVILIDEAPHCVKCNTKLRMSAAFMKAFKEYASQPVVKKEE